jgi:hypothetical protein
MNDFAGSLCAGDTAYGAARVRHRTHARRGPGHRNPVNTLDRNTKTALPAA